MFKKWMVVEAKHTIETMTLIGTDSKIRKGQMAKVCDVSPCGVLMEIELIGGTRDGKIAIIETADFRLCLDAELEARKHLAFSSKRFSYGPNISELLYGGEADGAAQKA